MIRIIVALLLFLVLEVVVIAAVGQFMLFADLKHLYTTDVAGQLLVQQLQAPIETVKALIRAKNPLFFIGSFSVIVGIVYVLLLPKSDSQGWRVHEKNAYHGSARWARKHEIFDENYKAVSMKTIQQDMKKQLEGR
ncbi:MAG: hypothetical protein UHX00_01300 [Caryophanon sp.]|nr:hypothetical protein [Caryophanon sp.]